MSIYQENPPRLGQLERRTTAYQWDLETAPAWDRMSEHGLHSSPELLRDFGVDVERLGEHYATFDWLFAASSCMTFIEFEEQMIAFVQREGARLLASKSLDAFVEEEEKHILLYRRYAESLLDRRDRALFERVYAPTRKRLSDRLNQPQMDDAARHYLFWANAIFFEEASIYLEERLGEMTNVQPTWLSINRLHRIEEIQHVQTDEAYIEALNIEPARRQALSQAFAMALLMNLGDTVGISAGLEYARIVGLGELCPAGRVTKRPFIRQVLERPTFRRTRACAPALAQVLGG